MELAHETALYWWASQALHEQSDWMELEDAQKFVIHAAVSSKSENIKVLCRNLISEFDLITKIAASSTPSHDEPA